MGLVEDERKARCPEHDAGIGQLWTGLERLLIMVPAHELKARLVHEVAAAREIPLAQLAGVDLVVLRDAAVLRHPGAEVAFPLEVARRHHGVVGERWAVHPGETRE